MRLSTVAFASVFFESSSFEPSSLSLRYAFCVHHAASFHQFFHKAFAPAGKRSVLDANLNNTLKCKHRMGEKNREREFVCVS